MTKAELANEIAHQTNVNKFDVQKVIEAFMKNVKQSLSEGENVYLREFGTFAIKHRAEKPARDITRERTVIVPAHNVPSFKPSKNFVKEVKQAKNASDPVLS